MKKREIERHRKIALQFATEGKAYIHAEYNEDGQSLIVSGEAGVLLVLVRRIARLAQITDLEEDEVFRLIKESEDWEVERENDETDSHSAVRSGRWIGDGSFKFRHAGCDEPRTMRRFKCSVCNLVTQVDGSFPYPYCPHCGAKMDEEDDQTD